MLEKDEFLFRLYEEHVQAREAERASREQTGDLTAAAILTALVDWVIAQRIPNGIGVIDAIYGALGNLAPLVTMAVLFCAALIVKWSWFADTKPDCIYYPPLDRELRDKESDTPWRRGALQGATIREDG